MVCCRAASKGGVHNRIACVLGDPWDSDGFEKPRLAALESTLAEPRLEARGTGKAVDLPNPLLSRRFPLIPTKGDIRGPVEIGLIQIRFSL
jgi:hypothetical protein